MKFEEVELQLNQDIAAGQFGEQLPSSRQLAQRYGVSKTSIERAVAELRAAGRVVTIPRVGHRLVKPSTPRNQIGFLWPRVNPGSRDMFHDAFDQIREHFPPAYNLLVQSHDHSDEGEHEALLKFQSMELAGLLAYPRIAQGRLVHRELYEKIARMGTRIVFLMRDIKEIPATSVCYCNRSYMELVMKWLAGRGASVRVHLSLAGHEMERLRRAHFMDEFAPQPGCYWSDLPEIVADNLRDVVRLFVEDMRCQGIDRAAKRGRLGLSCSNDLYVVAGWLALRELGITDAVYVSTGSIRLQYQQFFKPPVPDFDAHVMDYPTISFRAADIGRIAMTRLLYMIENNEPLTETIALPVRFVDEEERVK